ncbi:16S rRNA (uracil(1498)-N(3))-methyltransferase [Paralimibaculum aggregatum]|uniref:Ribosomal RNA small subunit methyltransferase E n=1 Tax=Paralimibaculum aggregatum TaxID=3036245 RepID=A0ABQ6LS76_9RHOB|nr:16S rRNA (uracil(1498)-N(3))-methyltransferase [Limibaculum sp. NKW23]GMG84696.1 16S rRNA (uracil(1498)-N(3))-methyltransferase [Limibaculum sp. NKW23]
MQPKIRLHVDLPLAAEAEVGLAREQAHYLFSVMRLAAGDRVALFNGRDGEWAAEVVSAGKRAGVLACRERLRQQTVLPDLWLLFAPLKKARTDFVAEKACEMGCARLWPVFTQHTNAERVRPDRLRAHAVEAAEQCGLLAVPEVAEPCPLAAALAGWDPARRLLFCDERGGGVPAFAAVQAAGPGPWAVLVGPEGGFSEAEAERLRALPFAHAASLGPRILRADTAAVAALALLQAAAGDWR